MKIIVTHTSPDWDAIASVWLLKKYLPGWQEAEVKFVPAGQRLPGSTQQSLSEGGRIEDADPIEKIGEDEVIHVDTGLGPLDHHHTSDTSVSAVSLTWNYVKKLFKDSGEKMTEEHEEAVSRIVKIIVDTDHFKEVFWADPAADYHEFSLLGVLEGLQYQKPGQDGYYVEFGISCLNAILHDFENRIWAEKEIKSKATEFETKWGKAIGFETLNDTVMKLAQKIGYLVVVRKDPRKGYVRIKARPKEVRSAKSSPRVEAGEVRSDTPDIDLTLVYEQLSKMDPNATWYLHVSKKMLLNGTPKNPKMVPTKLSLEAIINVIKSI
ncbi:MAG TPA: hypothetical protein VJC10_01890 [Patescibacteria group bacterium]|nr:hypothetical protein [Patescibacteria group bacterium]